MHKKVLAVWAIAAVGLAACSGTPAKRPATTEPGMAQCQRFYADPAIDPVRDKILVPIRIGQLQPVDMLARRTHPTEQERSAIQALAKAFASCNARIAEKAGPPPMYRQTSNENIEQALAELQAGTTTYREFTRTLLYTGESDQIERERLASELEAQERHRLLRDHNGN
jgi:hypothetical protein